MNECTRSVQKDVENCKGHAANRIHGTNVRTIAANTQILTARNGEHFEIVNVEHAAADKRRRCKGGAGGTDAGAQLVVDAQSIAAHHQPRITGCLEEGRSVSIQQFSVEQLIPERAADRRRADRLAALTNGRSPAVQWRRPASTQTTRPCRRSSPSAVRPYPSAPTTNCCRRRRTPENIVQIIFICIRMARGDGLRSSKFQTEPEHDERAAENNNNVDVCVCSSHCT